MTRLMPCPACGRHVRVSERDCPFCGRRNLSVSAPARLSIALVGMSLVACAGNKDESKAADEKVAPDQDPAAGDEEAKPEPEPEVQPEPEPEPDETTVAPAREDSTGSEGTDTGDTPELAEEPEDDKPEMKTKYGAPRPKPRPRPKKKYGAPPPIDRH